MPTHPSLAALQKPPEHLQPPPSEDELRDTTASTPDTEKPKTPADEDPRRKEVYPFEFLYEDGNGKIYKGSFVSHILDNRQRLQVEQLAARMVNFTPYVALSDFGRKLNDSLAHMVFALDKLGRPDWAENLYAVKDPNVIDALYEEVALHEVTFLGMDERKGQS